MTTTFKLHLKSGERLYVNGAILRVDRKVSVEFLNDVAFLLESYVMQPEAMTSHVDRLYFCIQTMLLQNQEREDGHYRVVMHDVIQNSAVSLAIANEVDGHVRDQKFFDALKVLRPFSSLATDRTDTEPTLMMAKSL